MPARVETVGTRLRGRHAVELRRGDLINRHFVVASFACVERRFRHEDDFCARKPNEQTLTRACARACARIERAAATSRDVKCGNSSRKGDEKPFQGAATVIISYFNFIDEFFV